MNKIKEFYQSFAFIITFMFMSVLISAMFGKKFLSKFLLLVLVSQVLFNVDEMTGLIKNLGAKPNTKPITNPNTKTVITTSSTISGDVKNGYLYTGTSSNTEKQYSDIPRIGNGKVTYDIVKLPVSVVDKSKIVQVPGKAPTLEEVTVPPNKEKTTLNSWWENLKEKTSPLVKDVYTTKLY